MTKRVTVSCHNLASVGECPSSGRWHPPIQPERGCLPAYEEEDCANLYDECRTLDYTCAPKQCPRDMEYGLLELLPQGVSSPDRGYSGQRGSLSCEDGYVLRTSAADGHYSGRPSVVVTCKYDKWGRPWWVCGREELPVACRTECESDADCKTPCKAACRRNRCVASCCDPLPDGSSSAMCSEYEGRRFKAGESARLCCKKGHVAPEEEHLKHPEIHCLQKDEGAVWRMGQHREPKCVKGK